MIKFFFLSCYSEGRGWEWTPTGGLHTDNARQLLAGGYTQLVGGCTSAASSVAARPAAVALLLSTVHSPLYYCAPPPPKANMWTNVSPEKLGLLIHSEASGAPIELK